MRGVCIQFVYVCLFVFMFELSSAQSVYSQDRVVIQTEVDRLLQNARESNASENQLEPSLLATQKAFDLASSIRDSMRMAACLRAMGQYYIGKGNNLLSFEYYRKAMDISDRIGDVKGVSSALFSMGILSYSANDFKEGNRLFTLVLPSLYGKENERQYLTTLYLLGLCKTELGAYHQSDSLLRLALKKFQRNNDSTRIYECSTGILQLLVRQNKRTEAENWYAKLLTNTNSHLLNVLPWIEYEMSFLYEQNGQYNAALVHAEKAKKSIGDIDVSLYMELRINKMLSKIYEHLNRPEESFYYFKQATANNDSLNSEEIAKKLESLKLSSEIKSKQIEIDLLNSEVKINALAKRIYVIVISFLCAFLITLVFFLVARSKLTRKLRDRNEKLAEAMKKSDDLLLNILPQEVADELKETGATAARQYENVTVLFTDFVNFTGLTEKMTPTELVREIHRNFTAFDAIMEKHGLEKIKTIGDAYMAVGGLPNEMPDHALRVIQAAKEIRQYMKQSGSLFAIRIGIHSGAVVAGVVGVKKYAYDIWGDTVNTAARMEQNSEPGKINISGTTYELVKQKFACDHRGKIKVKNKGEIDMYFVQ